jgi:hypothetical protein
MQVDEFVVLVDRFYHHLYRHTSFAADTKKKKKNNGGVQRESKGCARR